MTQLSLSEKLEVIKNLMSSSVIAIVFLLVIIFLGFLFITTNRHNAKESKKVYLSLYVASFLALLIQYGSSLGKMVDYFMNHVFILVYFPNLAVYFLAIIVTNIIMWKSLFSSENKALRIINTTAFCIIHYLFILLLNTISMNKLNIFEVTSVYKNNDALALIELTSSIFIIWILLLGIYRIIIRKFQLKEEELVLDEIPEESRYNLNRPIISIDSPREVLANTKGTTLKEEKPLVKQEAVSNLYDSMLTVEDYKLLLELLKQQKHKEEISEKELEMPSFGDFNPVYRSIK